MHATFLLHTEPCAEYFEPRSTKGKDVVFAPQVNRGKGELQGHRYNYGSKIVYFHNPRPPISSTPISGIPERYRACLYLTAGVTNHVTVAFFWPFPEGQGHTSRSVCRDAYSLPRLQPKKSWCCLAFCIEAAENRYLSLWPEFSWCYLADGSHGLCSMRP